MSTTLEGFAIPVEEEGLLSHVDHTYVTSSDGKAWGCWGRHAGGRSICKGPGDSGTADCLSQPAGTAGIVYALTGVCHQTANRILRPSRRTVCGANGYGLSWALYGAYGGQNRVIDPAWKFHEAACGLWDWRPDPLYLAEDSERDHYFEALHAAHFGMAKALRAKRATVNEAVEEARRLEFEALVDAKLKGHLTESKRESMLRNRADMLQELATEMLAVAGKHALPEGGERANKLLNAFLVVAAGILEAHEFRALFDVDPGTQVVVAEPETAAKWIDSF